MIGHEKTNNIILFLAINIPAVFEVCPGLRAYFERGPRLTGDVWLGIRETRPPGSIPCSWMRTPPPAALNPPAHHLCKRCTIREMLSLQWLPSSCVLHEACTATLACWRLRMANIFSMFLAIRKSSSLSRKNFAWGTFLDTGRSKRRQRNVLRNCGSLFSRVHISSVVSDMRSEKVSLSWSISALTVRGGERRRGT